MPLGFDDVKKGFQVKQRSEIIPNEDVQLAAATEEPMFLSLLMHHKDCLNDVLNNTNIDANYFFWVQNARLFAIVVYHFVKHSGSVLTEAAIDEITRASDNPANERIFFDKIYGLHVNKDDYERLKNNLLNRYAQQRFYEMCWIGNNGKEGLINSIISATSDQTQLISALQDKIVELGAQSKNDAYNRIASISSTLDFVIDDIEDRMRNPEQHYGWMTGFKGFDDVMFGLRKGQYGIFVGYPNGGKTTVMINVSLGMALRGARVCYVTVESDENQITERILCNQSNVRSDILRKGGKEIEPFMKILKERKKELKEKIGSKFTIINVTQGTRVTDLLSLIDAKRRSVGFDVVFVDYLDVISSLTRYPNRPDLEIGEVSVMLQAYGRKHGVAMLTAQSFNNEMIKAIKKQLQKVKGEGSESKEIEDVIGIEGVGGSQKLSRDADYLWGLILTNHLTVYWLKSRPTGKPAPFVLWTNLPCCKLMNYDEAISEISNEPETSDDKIDSFIDRDAVNKKEKEEMLKNASLIIGKETNSISSENADPESAFGGDQCGL